MCNFQILLAVIIVFLYFLSIPTIRRLKETAGLAGQIKAAGEAVIAVLESLLARLDPAELDGPAVRSLDELSDTLDRYADRLYDATEGDDPDDELEED